MFDDYEFSREARKSKARAALALGLGAIPAIFFAGWILFLTYNAYRPDAWPYLGLWTAFGASYLFSYTVSKLRGVA